MRAMIKRVYTDVVEVGEVRLHGGGMRGQATHPGAGIWGAHGIPGTMGCVVRRVGKDPSILYMLSNYHVLAGPDCAEGDTVVDMDTSQTNGELAVWVNPIAMASYPNLMDVAVAAIAPGMLF